jgi:hypothetical protein
MMQQSETMRAASRLLLSHPIVCLLAALAAVRKHKKRIQILEKRLLGQEKTLLKKELLIVICKG